MKLAAALDRGLEKLAVRVSDVSGPFDSVTAPVSYSLGRVGNIPQALALGTMAGITDTSNPKDVRELSAAYEELVEKDLEEKRRKASKRGLGRKVLDYLTGFDPRGQGEAHVSAGGSEVLSNLGRVWSRPGISLPGRLLGTLASPAADLRTALMRADHYNPWAHTVTSYTNEPGVQAHELGHAQDFAEKNYPLLYTAAYNLPFVNLYHEGKASQNAFPLLRKAITKRMKRLADEGASAKKITEDPVLSRAGSRRVNRVLSGGYGTYVGSALGSAGRMVGVPEDVIRLTVGLPSALVGQLFGYMAKPWGELQDNEREAFIRTAKELQDAKDARQQEAIIKRFAASVRAARPKQRKAAACIERGLFRAD